MVQYTNMKNDYQVISVHH